MDCEPMIGQAWWLLGPSTLGETVAPKYNDLNQTRFRVDISISDGTDIVRDDFVLPGQKVEDDETVAPTE